MLNPKYSNLLGLVIFKEYTQKIHICSFHFTVPSIHSAVGRGVSVDPQPPPHIRKLKLRDWSKVIQTSLWLSQDLIQISTVQILLSVSHKTRSHSFTNISLPDVWQLTSRQLKASSQILFSQPLLEEVRPAATKDRAFSVVVPSFGMPSLRSLF